MPLTLTHIHILIKEIQKRQLVLRVICMRSKITYRAHLAQLVEVDTVGKATLSDRTYRFLLADEMRKKAKTETFMEKSRQEGEDLAAWKIKLVALECEFLASFLPCGMGC